MIPTQDKFIKLKKSISDETKILNELDSFYTELDKIKDSSEKSMVNSQIKSLTTSFIKINEDIGGILENLILTKLLHELRKIKLPNLLDIQK